MTKTLTTLVLLLSLTALAAAETTEPADPEGLRAELEQARSDLAEAAQRLASLTRQMSEQGLARRWAEIDPEQWRGLVGELPDGTALRRAVAIAWTPRLGVVMGADDQADGRVVRAVTPGGSAAAAGIEAGDRIISLDGIELGPQAAAEVRRLLHERQVGDKVTLLVERDGQRRTVDVELERPELPRMAMLRGDGEGFNFEGLSELIDGTLRPGRAAGLGRQTQLTPMHAGLEPYFGVGYGILVLRVDADNPMGLQAGDVILALNGEALSLPTDLMRQLLRQAQDDRAAHQVELEIVRRAERITLSGSWEAERVPAFLQQRGRSATD